MRYLIIILLFSTHSLATDALIVQMREAYYQRIAAEEVDLAKSLRDYCNAHYRAIPETEIGSDPKKSEIEKHTAISCFNSCYKSVNELEGNWDQERRISRMIGQLDAMSVRATELNTAYGIVIHPTTPPEQIAKDSSITSAKPKDKKKITATLSDGTKVGE